jgi:UDP-N-acetylenolpyruvoylglucosamine reductase
MPFDKLKADLAFLINQAQNTPEDAHELLEQVQEKLQEMRAFGLPLPDDLVRMARDLDAEFTPEPPPAP